MRGVREGVVGPGSVVCGEKPEGVEGSAAELKGAEDLDVGVG